ncbi:MAG: DUF4423 domain-containing protein, partial [Proteobacteria bacterium]
MDPSIFAALDYQIYLAKRLENDPQGWGAVSRMAQAVGCQRSQISRVAKGNVHLTIDQAFALTEFWKLSDAETEYFLVLVEHARASGRNFKASLEKKLARLRQEQTKVAKRINQPALPAGEKEILYYSAWQWAALHILSSIPDLQTAEAAARYLSMPVSQAKFYLDGLCAMGLVENSGRRYRFASNSVHLPGTSPLNPVNMAHWRGQAAEAARIPQREGLHYTVTQSLSREDFEKLKAEMLQTIERFGKVAAPSAPEEL